MLPPRPAPVDRVMLTRAVAGKTILITGAGGSIGSALALSLAGLGAARLLLLDAAEFGLFQLDLDLRASVTEYELIVGDIGDLPLLSRLFEMYQPEIVFHAAACKHVPLMEANPFAAARTNIVGTHCLLRAAELGSAQQVIVVSTDKAVDPISIMGATKRVAELLTLSLSGPMRAKAVRLPNVLGSSGSVGPTFRRQIERGGPVTITHPESMRYFLAVDQAADLLLAALTVDAAPALLIPDPGEPLRILDLAKSLIDRCRDDVEITITGVRPGDKLTEAMRRASETLVPTNLPALAQVLSTPSDIPIADLSAAVDARDLPALLGLLRSIIPEYRTSL